MKKTSRSIVLFLLFTFSLSYSQQDTVLQKIIKLAQTENMVMSYQDVLCNRIGGRITGSDAYENACTWTADQLKSWGLQVSLDEAGEVPVGFNRGAWFGKMISPREEILEFGTPSYTAGTKGVVRGHVVIMPETDAEFDSIKNKLKGAWVLINGENSDGLPRDRDSIAAITIKLSTAGALGTIQSAPAPIRLLDSRCVKSWDNLPTLCDIKLLNKQFNEIKTLVQEGKDVELQFDIRNNFKPGPVKYYNVIGVIPGTEYKDEYVVLGAHLDSYDCATGAVDNASGVAPMMEAVRIMMKAGVKPKRNIMIQLYAAEERGLLGSKAWVNNHKEILPKISAMINKDFGTNPITEISVPKVIFNDLKEVVAPIEALTFKYPFKFTQGLPFRKAGRGGTDSFSFMMEGVPTPFLRPEGPHIYRTTWHTVLDTYDQVIPDAQEQSTTIITMLVYGIANMNHLLPREGAFMPDGLYTDLNTNKGRITLNLDYQHVPITVANFVGLAEGKIKNVAFPEDKHYFDGTIWHRVVPTHVIQAGMPATKDTLEGPGYEFPNEIYNGLNHAKAGMLGMANAGPHTNGSQFYITLGDRSYLDGNYTLFGSVAEGMEVVDKIVQGDTIKSVNIVRIGEDAQKFIVTDESFKKMIEDAKQKVKAFDKKRLKDESDAIQKNYPSALSAQSGLKYVIKQEGAGNKFTEGAIIKVRYTGKFLLSEQQFVSTSEEGKPNAIDTAQIFDFTIGATKINHGLDETIADMKAGEIRTVVVPSQLAYDINGFYGKSIPGKKRFVISPNTSLVYQIEIVK